MPTFWHSWQSFPFQQTQNHSNSRDIPTYHAAKARTTKTKHPKSKEDQRFLGIPKAATISFTVFPKVRGRRLIRSDARRVVHRFPEPLYARVFKIGKFKVKNKVRETVLDFWLLDRDLGEVLTETGPWRVHVEDHFSPFLTLSPSFTPSFYYFVEKLERGRVSTWIRCR